MPVWGIILIFLAIATGGAVVTELIPGTADPAPADPAAPADLGGLSFTDPSIFSGASVQTITTDPSTWPYTDDDPYGAVCNAVARAEGYNVAGSNPFRLNNPGDISDGAATYGSESHSGSSVTHFPDAATGWSWLRNKWVNIVGRGSSVYSPDMTWNQIAAIWAGNSTAWSANVTRYLNVSGTDRVGDYFGV
jgi:hypothetical protein